MKQLNDESVKQIQLDILDKVVKFCEENNLVYFLCGGTLLGAIRHKGYIPWDDDIDLMMPRKDYETLSHTFKYDGLKLYAHELLSNYNKPFIKIGDTSTDLIENSVNEYKIGVNIDIFPLDGFPDNIKLIKRHINKIEFYRRLLVLKHLKKREGRSFYKSVTLNLSKYFLYFISTKNLLEKISNRARKYNFDWCANAGIAVWGYGKKEVCPKVVFESSINIEFENKFYKAPKDYAVYLSNVYGNFMELPPVEKRITHHDYKVYG